MVPDAEMAVEEAYGMESAEFVGAEKVTLPFKYARPLENVVVAVHVGMPLTSARTVPLVVDAIRARELAVFA
jgi:hypothetical protein